MIKEKMMNLIMFKWRLIPVLFIFLALFYACSDDNPVVNEQEEEEEEQLTVTLSLRVRDGASDMPSGGGVISSLGTDPTTAGNLLWMVDKNVKTKYTAPYKSFYVIWSCNESSLVNYYYLTSAEGSSTSDPKSWVLYGSNDNKEWVSLDKQNNQQFTERDEKKMYLIPNGEEYIHYKLDVISNGGAATTQIAEWGMGAYFTTVETNVSEMPEGGGIITPQYSSFKEGCGVDNLFDTDPETKYATPYQSFYLLWKGNKTTLVNHYSLTSAADSPENDPKSWVLSGSDNKKIWTTLDTQKDQQFSARGEVKTYQIENKKNYKYYKLAIEENRGGTITQIAELTMQELYTDIDDLMSLASGFSHSDHTPMGSHYENRHVTTDEDRRWLLDPTNEPPAPGSASHLYLVEFSVMLYPYGKPLPADVNQHAIGDCGGLAALASMAYVYPDFIMSLIKDNGDKSYTVSMFDPQGKPVAVTVSNRFLSGNGHNIDAVSGKNNKATWSTVLEKAIMKYNSIYKVNPDIGGIGSEHVVPLFTGDGNSFAFSPGKLNSKQLARAVKTCLTQGKLIIGGFNRGDLPVDGSKTVTYHAYTLMHSSDKNALFAMRNPWGGNPDVDGRADGVLNIPNNSTIPPTIDLRIVDPGIASNFGNGITKPYIPPTMKSNEMQMRVASHLLSPVSFGGR
ncbi:C2 family cysteine protease [Proteiniphilum sp.]|uniref:C2 family cysteine protease n=1 Tax=Proteiniphilum sp. TaxID=1926877 RepID=UPI002B21006C|nr:C2 family cysteine protease [Proteiniphilum sp.]MEA4918620.1 C2 family cysteine protease [Proteiniphilum sp.]